MIWWGPVAGRWCTRPVYWVGYVSARGGALRPLRALLDLVGGNAREGGSELLDDVNFGPLVNDADATSEQRAADGE